MTIERTRKLRPGRALETLIPTIESAVAGTGGTIRSPDSIVGRTSGAAREIDVSLRGKVGSADLLVIFECRDCARRQGVEWIEQLASERTDVGAQLAVAVSSSGFTRAAAAYARAHSVMPRRVKELDPTDIRRAFDTQSVTLVVPHLRIRASASILSSPPHALESRSSLPRHRRDQAPTPMSSRSQCPVRHHHQ